MDEQDAQRKDSGVKVHDYTPEKANAGAGLQPGMRTFEGKEEARTQARTFESQENEQTRARTFESQGDEQARVRSFVIQDDAGQAARKSSDVATVSVESASTGLGSMANVLLAWQREIYWFVNTRMNKNIQFFRQVSDMNGPSDFSRIQSQFAQEAITDYTFGVQQVLARSLSAAREGGEQIRHGAEKAASHVRSGTEQHT